MKLSEGRVTAIEVEPPAMRVPQETPHPAAKREASTIGQPQLAEQEDGNCKAITELLTRVGDTWTMQTIRALGEGPARFNALRRRIGDISQKMMTVTLRRLERDGFVSRKVIPANPPQVEYALTELGLDLRVPVDALARWTTLNRRRIEQAREVFDSRRDAS